MITFLASNLLPATATMPSNRQRLFILFFIGTLVDLVILGLFAEFHTKVHVSSFSMALAASVLLQLLLKLTIVAEHRVIGLFKSKAGAAWTALKYFCAWLILFGSKFVILEALSFAFGHNVHFDGILHGLVWLIIVVVLMVVAEELVARLFRRLA